MASIILKWIKFGTTKTLPRAGLLAKLKSGEKGLGQGGDQDGSSVEMVVLLEGSPISASRHQSGLYGRMAGRKPLLSKRHMTAHLEFAKMHLKDSQTMRNKIPWSNETKM